MSDLERAKRETEAAWNELVGLACQDMPVETAEVEAAIRAFVHELAEKQRAARGPCVNDTDGDGDCAACARNPQAPCRAPLTAAQAADLIDPEVPD